MIVASGSVALDLDLNGLNGNSSSAARVSTLRFAVAPNSFFTILVFNDVLRGPEPGSMALVPQDSATLPAALSASLDQLVIEKLPSGEAFDLAVRDGKTGSCFSTLKEITTITMPMRSRSASRGKATDFERVCQSSGPTIGSWCDRWKNLLGAAMQPIEITTAGQRRSEIGDALPAAAATERWNYSRA